MEYRSRTCSGRSGQPLMAYTTPEEAQWAADYQTHCRAHPMQPYPCPRCGHWHLAPQGAPTPSAHCLFCTGSDGSQKTVYPTAEAARRQAQRIERERGIRCRVYRCPSGSGWHLTSTRHPDR